MKGMHFKSEIAQLSLSDLERISGEDLLSILGCNLSPNPAQGISRSSDSQTGLLSHAWIIDEMLAVQRNQVICLCLHGCQDNWDIHGMGDQVRMHTYIFW